MDSQRGGVELGQPGSRDKASRLAVLGLKAVTTASLLVFLLARIDLSLFVSAIRQSVSSWLLLAFVATSLLLIVSTQKWDRLLAALGVRESWWTLLNIYTIGFFASSFLPGVVGGDAARWQITSQRTGQGVKVAATILVERTTGVAALVIMCAFAVLLGTPEFATLPVLLLVTGVATGLACGLAVALHRRLATAIAFRTRRSSARVIVRPLFELQRTLRRFPRKPLWAALLYSVAFYLSGGLTFYLICLAFSADVTFAQAVSVQVLISLLTLLPISIGGLGLTQAGDVYLLGILGVIAPRALGISFIRQAIAYSYVVAGGFLFVSWRSRCSSEEIGG